MTSPDDVRLIAELSLIFDTLVLASSRRGEQELEQAARQSLDAVTRWVVARETARILAEIDKPINHRTH